MGETRECAWRLLQGQGVNERHGYLEMTALMIASRQGHDEVVMLLLEEGASVDLAHRPTGDTALHYASGNGRAIVVKILLYGKSIVVRKEQSGRAINHVFFLCFILFSLSRLKVRRSQQIVAEQRRSPEWSLDAVAVGRVLPKGRSAGVVAGSSVPNGDPLDHALQQGRVLHDVRPSRFERGRFGRVPNGGEDAPGRYVMLCVACTTCSLRVRYSLLVHCTACSLPVHYVLTRCSLLLPYFFPTFLPYFFPTSSLLVSYFSRLLPYFFTTTSPLVQPMVLLFY